MANIWCEMDTMQIKIAQDTYTCTICSNIFTSPIQLTVHCIMMHGLLPCMHCLKLFGTEQLLNEHTRNHHSQCTYKCSDCHDAFTIEKDLNFHMIREHFEKQCPLCIARIAYDDFQSHLEKVHKITDDATAADAVAAKNIVSFDKFCLATENGHRFHCHLCQDKKHMNRLDKLISHFLYFHKLSLPSLVRYMFADATSDSIKFISSTNDSSTMNKCERCDLAYSWSIPRIFHQIYCHGSVYCADCRNCFENRQIFDEHFENCDCRTCDHLPAIQFCDIDADVHDVCSIDDADHLKTVHNFSDNYVLCSSTKASLMNFQNECNFCGECLSSSSNDSILHLDGLIKHFRLVHKFNANAILRCLNKRKDGMKTEPNEACQSNNKRSLDNSSIRVECELDESCIEFRMDFATNTVQYVYSSESDYDSIDSDDNDHGSQSRTAAGRSYQCELCERCSKSKYNFITHMRETHGFQITTPTFRCNVCSKFLKSEHFLKKHNQRYHHQKNGVNDSSIGKDQDKRFKCPFCNGFRCNGKSKMRQHIGEHVEASYHPCQSRTLGFNCKLCHMTFWTREKLNDHQSHRHADDFCETYLLCSRCFAIFNNLPTLRNHNVTRHQQDQHSHEKHAYRCNICRTVQYSIADVRGHMQQLHAEMLSMFCAKENCFQMIANEEELKEHWAKEHAKSTYQCLECFKRFKNKHFAENHIKTSHPYTIKMLKREENQSNKFKNK